MSQFVWILAIFACLISGILLLISGFRTTNIGSEKNDQIPLLSQDLNSLINSNGKIVESRLFHIKSDWSDETECYKIKYLSDSLKVVGFIVKPKADNSKFPAIIFNRGGNREFGKINEGLLRYLSYLSSKDYIIGASQYRGNDGG